MHNHLDATELRVLFHLQFTQQIYTYRQGAQIQNSTEIMLGFELTTCCSYMVKKRGTQCLTLCKCATSAFGLGKLR